VTALHLVRHGRATAGWDVDPDPGIDALGRHQAEGVADRLEPLGPLPIFTSPFRRCRETAAVLAGRWHVTPVIEAGVGEIPSPLGVAMADRVDWLRTAMRSSWTDLGPRYTEYRDGVVATLREIARRTPTSGAVVFSHFVAINALIGVITGDDRVLIHRLDNCSVTVVEVDTRSGRIELVDQGREADTQIR
jgi:broad specificity phosphatase PhoE